METVSWELTVLTMVCGPRLDSTGLPPSMTVVQTALALEVYMSQTMNLLTQDPVVGHPVPVYLVSTRAVTRAVSIHWDMRNEGL
jgi:hypothetical protein